MTLDELLSVQASHGRGVSSDVNPLTEENALQEAQMLDIRFDAVRSSVGVLYDLRTALQLQTANTGVFVATKVRDVTWSSEQRSPAHTAWNVISSVPNRVDGRITLSLMMYPQASLRVIAQSAVFYVVEVPGIGDAPPDYGAEEHLIRNGLPTWRSEFRLVEAVYSDLASNP
jgi:hypothetical protein